MHFEEFMASFPFKNVLFLQGPMSPFFNWVGRSLENHGAIVHKINFNAGDYLYSLGGNARVSNFRGSLDDWSDYLFDYLLKHDIECVIVFGEERKYHQAARHACFLSKVPLGVFEEGYLRPNYITFEWGGVNGNSSTPKEFSALCSDCFTPLENKVVNGYFWAAWFTFFYALSFNLGKIFFPQYRHHRPLGIGEALRWVRSWIMKPLERLDSNKKIKALKGKDFFLVPLQVFNDAQVIHHSPYLDVRDFIEDVLSSFSKSGSDAMLVLKHHPFDKASRDYSRQIAVTAERLGIRNQVVYLRDGHLPSLLNLARGVVTINSTVGLSALFHGCSVVATGVAVYAIPELTYQKGLDSFWSSAKRGVVDKSLLCRFKSHLLKNSQINCSFYVKN